MHLINPYHHLTEFPTQKVGRIGQLLLLHTELTTIPYGLSWVMRLQLKRHVLARLTHGQMALFWERLYGKTLN